MRITEKNIAQVIFVTIILVIFLGMFFRIQAVAKENVFSETTDAAELEYRLELKCVLADFGAKNAGITMTKTSEDGRLLAYKVNINLPKYIDFNSEKETELREALDSKTLNVEGAVVSFSFS